MRALAWLLVCLAPVLATVVPVSARADVMITYRAIDLTDGAPGEDLWRYRYTVRGFDHGPGHGFSILFEPGDFGSLSLNGTAGTPPEWDAIVLQPDPLLPSDGLYDALATSAPPDPSGVFEVDFVWLGGDATPGAQDFIVYEPGFATIGSGRTVVPEPGTAVLLAGGLAALRARRHGRTDS